MVGQPPSLSSVQQLFRFKTRKRLVYRHPGSSKYQSQLQQISKILLEKNKTRTSLLTTINGKSVQHILYENSFNPVLHILEKGMKLKNLKKLSLHKQNKTRPKVTSNQITYSIRTEEKFEATKKQVDEIDEGWRMKHHLDNYCSFGE